MRKTAVEAHYSCSMQKTDGRNSQYSKNERILKIGKMATMQNGQFPLKNKIVKKMRKRALQAHCSCSMQKLDGKNN